MLILPVPEDLHKLFQNGGMAAMAPLCKLGRIMVVTIYHAFMFVVTVLRSEHCGANRTSEMFYMIFAVQGCDIRTSKGATALEAKKLKSSEIIRFAQGVLSTPVLVVNREEFRRDYLTAILFEEKEK